MKSENEVTTFYDTLAPDYDSMTGFEKRFVAERPFFRLLVERYGIHTAIDAGCGTGFHSLLLAQFGVKVTAVDTSTAMLQQVERHALEMHADVQTVASDFEHLPAALPDLKFDAVFCLGNTLAHMLSEDALRTSLNSFASLLKPQGTLFLQILNYDRILAQGERIQNVKEVGNTTFVRFYDFEPELIRFNILKLQKAADHLAHSLTSITLRPIRKAEVATILHEIGFIDVTFYGAISLEAFTEKAKDLFVIAAKPN
jgi:ubiquinone/menaquinone biosynthesis C-methylase UbiE